MSASPVLLLFALAACGGGAAAGAATTVRDSSGVAIIEHDLTRLSATCTIDSTPRLSIGVEEGEEPYMLTRLGGAMRLSDGRVVLADRQSHEIRYFDSTGAWIRSSGRQGQGPGEFTDPFYINVLPGDTIYVGDFRPFQFLVFDEKGDWVRTVRPDPVEVNNPASRSVLADGRLVLGREDASTRPANFEPTMMRLDLYDAQGKRTDSLASFPNGRYGRLSDDRDAIYIFPLFESFAQARARKDRIVTGHASRTELRVRRSDAGSPLDRIIRWNAGSRRITPADIEADRVAQRARAASLPEAMRPRFLDPLISDQRPVADSFPAFGMLMLGSDDGIWIREFPRPTDSTAHHWIGFDRDGAFRCRLDTRRFSEYLDWGRDYLLVLDPDSVGVVRVREFRLRMP